MIPHRRRRCAFSIDRSIEKAHYAQKTPFNEFGLFEKALILYHLILIRRWPTPSPDTDERASRNQLMVLAEAIPRGYPIPRGALRVTPTELQIHDLINLSGTKNVEEAAGDIRFCVAPRNTGKNSEKRICYGILLNDL